MDTRNLLATCALLLALITCSSADTVYVWTNSPVDGPGTAWTNAFRQLQDGIDAAVAGDTVLVTNGVYTSGTEWIVTNTITIESVNGADVTIVDGENAHRCFSLHDSESTLIGFTIRNGWTDNNVWPDYSGAGVSCSNGLPSVISHCRIIDNVATNDGGGLYNAIADHCLITGNQAHDAGGGAYASELSNCLLISNSVDLARPAYGYGGGSSGCWLKHCTIVGNKARISGGAHIARATNCVIYGNTATESGDNWYVVGSGGTNIYYSCTTPDPGKIGNITNAPLFMDADSGDYRLRGDSPCIDIGLNEGTSDDFDGNTRPVDGNFDAVALPDMGAFEYDPTVTDTDGDSLLDVDEYTLGFDLARNSTGAIAYGEANVTSNPSAYGLYTSNSIMDLSMGTLMQQMSNGSVYLDLQLQHNTNLVTGSWTNIGSPKQWSQSAVDGKSFFRVWSGN